MHVDPGAGDDRVLARSGQPRLPEPGLLERPADEGGDRLGRYVQDQAAGAVREDLAVLDVEDRERTVLEPQIVTRRDGPARCRTTGGRRLPDGPTRHRLGGGGEYLCRPDLGRRRGRGRRPGASGPGGGRSGLAVGLRAGGRLRRRGGRRGGRRPARRRLLRGHADGGTGRRGGLGTGGLEGLGWTGRFRGVELRELAEQPRVGVALRRSRVRLAGLPAAHGGAADPQRLGHLVHGQAVGLPQPLVFLRWRQRRAGRDEGVDHVEQHRHEYLLAATLPRESTHGVHLAYVMRTKRVQACPSLRPMITGGVPLARPGGQGPLSVLSQESSRTS